ncbi:UNVERIFIED_CONTAM: hypothetical protein GTU68_004332 [Idotea baltica]|nr:hypothetical protein [Idotea baltica]
MSDPLTLDIKNLRLSFRNWLGTTDVLHGIDLRIAKGERVALVGESGSGKSVTSRIVLGNLSAMSSKDRRGLRGRDMSMIFQDPTTALNPVFRIGELFHEALDVHNHGQSSERAAMVAALLEEVGLEADMARRAPAGMSGGQRQRIAIARALACQSEVVVLDEPTSALDVLVQARVLRLLNNLREKRGLTYIFITHDLSVVRNIADRVAVFQQGNLLEVASTIELFSAPKNDYTRGLMSAVPVVSREEIALRDALAR